jgi:hypothetical protein
VYAPRIIDRADRRVMLERIKPVVRRRPLGERFDDLGLARR